MTTDVIDLAPRDAASAARRTPIVACWIQHGGEVQWASLIARELRDQGVTMRFASYLSEMHVAYAKLGLPSDFLGEVYRGPSIDEDQLVELERRYGPPGLRTIGESDVHLKHLFGKDDDAKIQAVARALRFWEGYFVEHRISGIVVRDQASVVTRTARQVAMKLGNVRILQFAQGPDDHHFTLCDVDTTWNWSELDRELAKGFRPIDPDRRQLIEAFVAGRVQPRRKKAMALNLSVPHPLLLPLALRQFRREERAVPDHDPVARAIVRLRREMMVKRATWRMSLPLRQYDPPPAEGEKFAYFPLFHTEESVHLVNIPFWARHVDDLAVAAAEALPLGHTLYIKEHPAILGDVPYRTLRRLRRHPRIRLVSPQVQSQGLIAQSKAVIVLEGSAGWEALLLRRPCVVVGVRPFYAKFPLSFPVENVCDLNVVLPRAVAAETLYEERHAEWLWFIDCVMRTAPAGVIESYEFPHTFPETPENLGLVTAAIARKLAGLPAVPDREEVAT
jgi:hypothetical protein